jgi:phosphoribosylformylglycinamidine cyclo-ligase
MAHITGGGITENLPRVLPDGCAAAVDRFAWVVPPIFLMIQQLGSVDVDEMYRAFNMGIGLVVVVAASEVERARATLEGAGEHCVRLGQVVAGAGGVRYL